jgi:penicillin amidase
MFPLNMVFASTSGDIGYHMTGLFPKRKFNVGQGVYPKKGWLKDNLWEGLIPPEEHPRLYNPESGLIVTANNFVASKHIKHGVSHAFSFT